MKTISMALALVLTMGLGCGGGLEHEASTARSATAAFKESKQALSCDPTNCYSTCNTILSLDIADCRAGYISCGRTDPECADWYNGCLDNARSFNQSCISGCDGRCPSGGN
jgi:hypothetical protein